MSGMKHLSPRHVRGGAAIAIIAAILTVSLDAFGDSGHRIIGRLAEMHLRDSTALSQVRQILRPGETLADAAVWPDTIRNPLYEDEDTALIRLQHPGHDTYHYANLPFQADRYDLSVPGARPTDLVQTMRVAIRVLQGQPGIFTKREALRMLAHLAGDVHQPLHVGNGFVSERTPLRFVIPQGSTLWRSTLGGNMLLYGPQDRFNLHSYWDTHAVNLSMRKDDVPTYAERLFREMPARPEWKNEGDIETWPVQWATEALAHAKDLHEGLAITAYLGADNARRNPHRWRIEQPERYDDLARARIPVQLATAGYRLAATLKGIWPDGS